MPKEKKLKCLIPSYYIKGNDFRKIIKLAEKGDSSWHYPAHMIKFLSNPLPLFLFDELYIDKISFDNTLELLHLQTNSYHTSELIERIGALPHVNLFNASEIIGPKVPEIYKSMINDKRDPKFEYNINTIERLKGQYARPNNYNFELINMNITTTLIGALGNAHPYDEDYRSLLYEEKIVKEMQFINKYKSFEDRIKHIRWHHIAQPPLELANIDDINTIAKEHKSKSLKAFREKFKDAISNSSKFNNFLQYELSGPQRQISKLATGWDVFFDSIATFGAWMGAMTATGGWTIPAFIIYVATGGKLIKDMNEWTKADNYLWYEGFLQILNYLEDNQKQYSGIG